MAAKKDQSEFMTDPYGIIERGAPGGGGGSSVSVGRVGSPVQSLASPGQTFGTGVGGRMTFPIGKQDATDVKKKAKGGKVQTSADTARKLATEMGGMKKGGKAGMYANGGVIDRIGRALSGVANEGSRKKYGIASNRVASSGAAASGAAASGAGGGGRSTGKSSQAPVTVRPSNERQAPVTVRPKKDEEITVRPKKEQPIYVRPNVKTKTVKLQAHKDGGKAGMEKGGKPKSGLAVMIAIGKTKPVKKAVGGAGKTRKGMCDAPAKFAKGGAGKVRKGMMTPEGKIIDVMNKIRGK